MAQVYLSGPLKGQPIASDLNWIPSAGGIPQLTPAFTPPPVPAPLGGLTSRTVTTVPVDAYGNPIGLSGARPITTQGAQPAGTVQMPPGARPASVDRAFAQMAQQQQYQPGMLGRGQPTSQMVAAGPAPGSIPASWKPGNLPASSGGNYGWTIPGEQSFRDFLLGAITPSAPTPAPRPPGRDVIKGDDSRLGTIDPRMAFNPEAQNPTLSEIDLLPGSGNSTIPRPNPFGYLAPPSVGGKNPPSVPSPRGTIAPITFRKGDTVWDLAKERGMTVNAFASLYGIKDPNKIRAGQTVIPRVPSPRTPTVAQRTPPRTETRAERFTNLDPWGNII